MSLAPYLHRTDYPMTAGDLAATDARQVELHSEADAVARGHFGNQVFVRGVIEISNFCRQNCNYCGMRRDNRALKRFRLSLDVVRDVIFTSLPPSITDINIQAGEDVIAVRELVLPLVEEIRARTHLGVSVCVGTLPQADYDALRAAGASYYIIKLETGDKEHYREVNAPGTFETRLAAIHRLASSGWAVSSGFIAGLPGQTTRHLLATLQLLSELPLAGTSVSPFIPGDQTPFGVHADSDVNLALNSVAMMRLANPHRVIPAVSAMNILDKEGYRRALRAGANLTTVNLTPAVWREDYLLYQRDRFIMNERRVLEAIERAGLEASPISLAEHLQAGQASSFAEA